MMRKIFIWLPFFCLFFNIYGQVPDFRFENFYVEDGLPHNYINNIQQDDNGFIWVSTEGGLVKYDGYTFETYRYLPFDSLTHPFNGISFIYKLKSGDFFFNNIDNSYLFNPISKKVTQLPIKYYKNSLVIQAKDSTIWMGTRAEGVIHFDKNFSELKHYKNIEGDSCSLTNNLVRSLFEDESGNIWVGLTHGGVNKIDRKLNKVKRYPFVSPDHKILKGTNKALSAGSVNCILQVSSHEMWLGTNNGLAKYDINKREFEHFPYTSYHFKNIGNSLINTVFLHDDKIWCGTSQNGIMIFDLSRKQYVKQFLHNSFDENTIGNNRINHFFYSRNFEDGVLWMSMGVGISKVDLNQKSFVTYTNIPGSPTKLSFQNVRSVFKEDNSLWVGSGVFGGLDVLDLKINSNQTFQHKLSIQNSIGPGAIGSIVKRPDGKYWLATWEGALSKFDFKSGIFQTYQAYHNNIGLEGWVFCEGIIDYHGNFWLSSLNDGLLKMPAGKEQFTKKFRHNPDSSGGLPSNVIRKIILDKNPDIIWLGTDAGLSKFNTKTETFSNYLQDKKKYPNLPCNKVTSIFRDKNGIFWLGMEGCGLIKFDHLKEVYENYTTQDGLSSNSIYGIYEDKKGFLWMSSLNGISCFNPQTATFRNFDKTDGLQGNQFNWGADFQDEEGKIYFGGSNGLTVFLPEEIQENNLTGQVVFTRLLVKNTPIKIGEKIDGQVVLPQDLNEIPVLEIGYKTNDITIEFSSTNYLMPSQNRYKFKLEGYDSDWKYSVFPSHHATYTNLSQGDYILKIVARNSDNTWGEQQTELNIKVYPPWWNSLWFKSVAAIFMLSIGILVYRIRVIRLKKQKKWLEQEVEKRTFELQEANEEIYTQNEELEQLNGDLHTQREELAYQNEELHTTLEKLKLAQTQLVQSEKLATLGILTAGIAHEINNPVNFIKAGAVGLEKSVVKLLELMNKYDKIDAENLEQKLNEIKKYKEAIQYSYLLELLEKVTKDIKSGAKRTAKIVEDLRAFSKSEDSTIKTENIHHGLDSSLLLLHSHYKNRIKIIKNYNEIPPIEGNHSRINQVFMNLLMNGVQAINGEGTITINTKFQDSQAFVSIKDSGIGISPEIEKHIFEPFFSTKDEGKATGLGLSISLNIIKDHNGKISVESEIGKGTEFTVTLPVNYTVK